MNYRVQRKLFNFICLKELVAQLSYHYSSNKRKRKIQEKHLRRCMENAYQIPFYRKRFDSVGLTPTDIHTYADIAKLPILTKEQYRDWILAEKKKSENKECMLASTSGSSGRPLEVLNTPREYAIDIMSVMRSWMICGYNPFFNMTLTALDETSERVGYKTLIQKLGILRRDYVDERNDEIAIINKINELKPGLLQMYKSELVRVAKYAQQNHLKVSRPKFYGTSGENVDEISRRIMRETFGDNLISLYGCVETGTIAVEKPGVDMYDVHDDLVALNICDENGNVLPDGTEGRIVFTTLYKDTFPLINYDVKDRAIIKRDSSGTHITKILGRENDCIKHKDGSSTGWIHLWYVISNQKDIVQARFIQNEYETVTLQLVAKKEVKSSLKEMETNLKQQLEERMKHKTKVCIEWLEDIPSDPSGKLRMVVCNI